MTNALLPRTLAWLLAVPVLLPAAAAEPPAAPLVTVAARAAAPGAGSAFESTVEAVRQTVVAAQVSGAIVELRVRAGDRVRAGELLLRIDARAAELASAAGQAQAQGARAALDAVAREFERQRQLFQKGYISQAALDQAESAFKTGRATAEAQLAQADVARTQTGFHQVRAPYDGVVSEVNVALGDMALPGRPLLAMYDPRLLRVTASVPHSAVPVPAPTQALLLEFPGSPAGPLRLASGKVQWLPTADPATHTVQVRAELPPRSATSDALAIVPGQFARLWLGAAAAVPGSPGVPLSAVVRRAELTALYVLDGQGRPLLRQVRLGRVQGDSVEVLSGLSVGERVVADPQAAARLR
jgi:membrane fusion protein, multidrug efflux system